MEETKKHDETAQLGIGAVSGSYDFWQDATSFIKTIVNENAEQMIAEHIKEKGFNDNEMRFFREYLAKAFDMYAMMSYLKYNCH